jgi:hypothetical protein
VLGKQELLNWSSFGQFPQSMLLSKARAISRLYRPRALPCAFSKARVFQASRFFISELKAHAFSKT